MDFVMSPADLEKMVGAASRIDSNPLKLVGRAVGLGDAEMRAGVPVWAWVTLALAGGLILGVKFGPEVTKRLPW